MKSIWVLLLTTIALISCDKSDENPEAPDNGNFSFSISGTPSVTADSTYAKFINNQWYIFAYKGNPAVASEWMFVQLRLPNLTPDTYSFSPQGGASSITAEKNAKLGAFFQGSIIISQYTGSRVSGTIIGSQTQEPSITSISGSFTNVPIR